MVEIARKTQRILIADDHGVYRAGLSMVLRNSGPFGDIAEAESFDDALDMLADEHFELALFDLEMPGMNGPETLREVRLTYPAMAIIIVSANTDEGTISTAMAAGVDAYITKATSLPSMLRMISDVLGRRDKKANDVKGSSLQALTPVTLEQIETDSFAGKVNRTESLTVRQRDVLGCVHRGLSNKEIARELNIAPGTVKIHMAALFAYYNTRNRTELAIKSRPSSE